jgi:hypothetical protein
VRQSATEGEGDAANPGNTSRENPLELLFGRGDVECGSLEGLDYEELEEILGHGLLSWKVFTGERDIGVVC